MLFPRDIPGRILLICGLPIFLLPAAGAHALTYSINGDWRQSDSSDGLSDFRENYSADLQKQFEYSDRFRSSLAVRGFRSNGRLETIDAVYPSADLSVDNNLFLFTLNGTVAETMIKEEPDLSSSTWQAILNSRWSESWKRPAVRLSYGQSRATDDGDPREVDSGNSYFGSTVDWRKLRFLTLYYNYNWQESRDHASGGSSTGNDHLVRMTASRTFFDTLAVNLSQQYRNDRTTSTTPAGSGGVLLRVPVSGGFFGLNSTPATATLPLAGALIDSNRRDSAVTIGNPVALPNIGIRVDFRTVNMIHLFTVGNIAAIAGAFTWDFYTSDDNLTWVRRAQNLPASYSPTERRFVFSLPNFPARYLKLVATAYPAATVELSEIEALEQVTNVQDELVRANTYSSYAGEANASWRIRPDLGLTYNFSYENTEPTDRLRFENKTFSATLDWRTSDTVTTTIGAAAATQSLTDQPDSMTRTYHATVSSLPLPTVSLVTDLSYNEHFRGEDKVSRGYSAVVSTTSQIFTDLSASLDLGYDTTDSLDSGLTSDRLESRLTLSAMLRPTLQAILSSEYSKVLQPAVPAETVNALTLNWRPSADFSLLGQVQQYCELNDRTVFSLDASMVPGEKIRFTTGYSLHKSDGVDQMVDLAVIWSISRYLSFISSGDYHFGDIDDGWTWFNQLSAHFNGP
ncbi:MAG: hypothetical protein AB1568_01000 [Thermodesulfobacteriota bacterium]